MLKRTPVDRLIQSGQTERRRSPFPRCLKSMRVSERGSSIQQTCLMGGMWQGVGRREKCSWGEGNGGIWVRL